MSYDLKLGKAAAVAFLALAMAGCGGGGGTTMPPDTGPTAEEQLATLQAQVTALREQLGITDAGDIGTSIADLQAELKRLQDEAQARMDAEQAATEKAMAEDARKLALRLDASPLSFFNAGESLSATAMYGKPTTVTVTGVGGGNPNFKAENSKLLGMLNGWSGTELMSTSADGSVTDVLHMYTDIEPDETVPFAEWAGPASDVTWANGAVTVAAGNSALIMATPFATGSGSKTHELNVNTDADAANEVFQTAGTFGGASGTYTCTGDGTQTCTSAVASSDGGVLLAGAGATWTFTPDTGATAKVADSSYGYFGWWLRKTGDEYTRLTVLTAQGVTAAVTAVAGTATYTGLASGLYSIYDSGPKGGRFTAEVEFKADFGSAADAGTISGMISNFSDSAGTDPASMDTWEVTLPETPMAGLGGRFGTPTSGATAAQRPVWTIDGEAGTPASSTAQYYGYHYTPDDGGTPEAATGAFSAEYGVVGNMTGGFGVSHSGP